MMDRIRKFAEIASENVHIRRGSSGVPESTKPCAKIIGSRSPSMKRFQLLVAGLFLLSSADLTAAVGSGTGAFATKRGQKPVVTETLVWLDAQGGKAPPKRPPA